MDLKALLVEAKQKVPPVLQVLQTGDEAMLDLEGEHFISLNLCFQMCRLNSWRTLLNLTLLLKLL